MAFIKNHKNCDCDCAELEGPCDDCETCHDLYYIQFSECEDVCYETSLGGSPPEYQRCLSIKLSKLNGLSYVVYQPSYKFDNDTILGQNLMVECSKSGGAESYHCPCEYNPPGCYEFGGEYAGINMICYPTLDNRLDINVDYVDEIYSYGANYTGTLKDGVHFVDSNFTPFFPHPSCKLTVTTTPPP